MPHDHIFIVNLRYTPGMWQHMEAFASSFQQQGFPVRLLISSGYDWMNAAYARVTDYTAYSNEPLSVITDVLSTLAYRWLAIKRVLQQYPPAAILIVSWHPLNFLLIKLAKRLYPEVTVITCIHEPYKEEKKVYRGKAMIIYLAEHIQTFTLLCTDVAILHSSRGLRMFRKRYPWFKGRPMLIPLQFTDDGPAPATGRRYVSFLGRAVPAKGIDRFFELVRATADAELPWDYQIVTSSDLGLFLQALPPAALHKLKVIHKPHLSDQEIRQAAGESLAVLALYQETTQSGIIPIALMKGAPIVGTDIEGITEWIKDGETGMIVSRNPSVREICAALTGIQENFGALSTACRQTYLSLFDCGTLASYFTWLQDRLRSNV